MRERIYLSQPLRKRADSEKIYRWEVQQQIRFLIRINTETDSGWQAQCGNGWLRHRANERPQRTRRRIRSSDLEGKYDYFPFELKKDDDPCPC